MRTLLATVMVLSIAAQARTIYVKPGATGSGSSWASATGTVQAGLNAAAAGDEVWVAAGTYTENLTLKAGVSLYGGFNGTETARDQRDPNANASILDGGQKGPVITISSGAGNETVIDSLTIQNGSEFVINAADPIYGGAAVYAPTTAPTVSHCIVQGCGPFPANDTALHMGVIYSAGAALVEYNVIRNNAGAGAGTVGGTVIGNTISGNTGGSGIAGAHLAAGNNLTNNLGGVKADIIEHNVVMGSSVAQGTRVTRGGYGAIGATLVSQNWFSGCTLEAVLSSNKVIGNWVIGNTTSIYHGVGIDMAGESGPVADNLIANNGPNGAGIALSPQDGDFTTVVNNTIVGNFRNLSQPNTYNFNGAGISYQAIPTSPSNVIANNIIAFNDEGISTIPASAAKIPILRNNDVFGNTEGNYVNLPDPTGTNGNISADPLFVNRAGSNYHLQSTSPCINTGDDSVVIVGDTDLEEAPRIVGPHVDMGAYESLSRLPFTFSEAVNAVRILGGLKAALPSDLQRLNVIGADTSASVIDVRDAGRLVRKAAGLDANP